MKPIFPYYSYSFRLQALYYSIIYDGVRIIKTVVWTLIAYVYLPYCTQYLIIITYNSNNLFWEAKLE